MEPAPTFNFMSFDGLAMEDQQKLQSILFGAEKQKEVLPPSSGIESPTHRHIFNVHAQVFVPKTTQAPPHALIGVPFVQYNNSIPQYHQHQQLMQHNPMPQPQPMMPNHCPSHLPQNHVQPNHLAQNHVQHQMNQLPMMNSIQNVSRNETISQENTIQPQQQLQQQPQQHRNDQHGNYHQGRPPRYQYQNSRYNDRQAQGDWGRSYGRMGGHNKRITVLQNPNSRRYHTNGARNDGNLPPRFHRNRRDSGGYGDGRKDHKSYDEDINSNTLKLRNGLEPKVDNHSSLEESDDERITVSLNASAPSVSNVKWPSDDSKTCSPPSRSLSPASSAASEVKSPNSDGKRDSLREQHKPARKDSDRNKHSGEYIRTSNKENKNREYNNRSFNATAQKDSYRRERRYNKQEKAGRGDKVAKHDSSDSLSSLDGVEVRRRDFNIFDDEWSQEFGEEGVEDDWRSIEPDTLWSASGFNANNEGKPKQVKNEGKPKTAKQAVTDISVKEKVNNRGGVSNAGTRTVTASVVAEPVQINNQNSEKREFAFGTGKNEESNTAATVNGTAKQVDAGNDGTVAPMPVRTVALESETHGKAVGNAAKPSSVQAIKQSNPQPSVVTGSQQTSKEKSAQQPSGTAPRPSNAHRGPTTASAPQPSTTGAPTQGASGASSQGTSGASSQGAPGASATSAQKSWAALVSQNLPAQFAVVMREESPPPVKTELTPPGEPEHIEEEEEETGDLSNDKLVKKLREYLRLATLHHRPPSVFPRGLINRANWCYVNATLQALLACPPFYNLFKNIPRLGMKERGQSCTPVIDSICQYVHEFQFMKPQANRIKKQEQSTIATDEPFEPEYVYKMLLKLKSTDAFKQGRQEDAEEFLTCVLNHMHDELLAITTNNQNEAKPDESHLDESEDWEQVGRKKKAVVITRSNEMPRSLVSDIFCGQIRAVLRSSGSRESATLEPFFTLPLDIQHEKIRSVKDALTGLVSRESIQGFTCSKTKEEIEATRCTMLELLPPVLILHLKCFIYDKNGGCQKLGKEIEYTVDLEISKEIISQNARGKIRDHQRCYKLFAVVYHRGKTLQGGHYTTDVYHSGINGWIRIDDHNIAVVPVSQVLQYSQPYMPYLLYYRRHDSLGPDRSK